MEVLLPPREAAKQLGFTVRWLQEMDRMGKIKAIRMPSGRRRFPQSEVNRLMGEKNIRKELLYARVSSHDQKHDLERQKTRLLQKYPGREMFSDIRSGLKFDRPGFQSLLKAVQSKRVSKVVIMYKDRLARFGFDLLQQIFESYGTEIEVLEQDETQTPEQELSRDLISIITSFSARLYGLRSHKTKKLVATAREVIRSPEP